MCERGIVSALFLPQDDSGRLIAVPLKAANNLVGFSTEELMEVIL